MAARCSSDNPAAPPLRIGSVSYLNARPLIYGLERRDDLQILLDVPARLLGGMQEGRYDVALLPVIDYQRMEGLVIVPAGGIGCDGPTMTVRIFSRVPIDQIRALACDGDSHTSVVLARILLSRLHGRRVECVDLASRPREQHMSMLLIGDKVVCDEPQGYPHQLDLGQAWKEMTGLPFVFAVWMARRNARLGALPQVLREARRQGEQHVQELIERHALPIGWSREAAAEYLQRLLHFSIGPMQLDAIRLFHACAAEEGLIPNPPRPLEVWAEDH
jgi:chorismate dehydratase